MDRKTALSLIRFAGYHQDDGEYLRIMLETRMPRAMAVKAWTEGRDARKQGQQCTCYRCEANTTTTEIDYETLREVPS